MSQLKHRELKKLVRGNERSDGHGAWIRNQVTGLQNCHSEPNRTQGTVAALRQVLRNWLSYQIIRPNTVTAKREKESVTLPELGLRLSNSLRTYYLPDSRFHV